ncbi:phosphoribosyltransferase family protein [Umezawaea sp. Da 62-37]|uniref:phosphoribosyltransferase n=1 Tax=Umezawaea sp. Da 62-37 TaxID=3075927 RepID=UPI0028F7394F|nr:phosphoribosyltransferase family protein [Umezawaea sp. Da 62-37]WNV90237.1 phosphoribosyltransferase family protein [Umezawaea sp. Da 62-37]
MNHTAQRVFEHQRIWRVTPDALREACLLLFAAISHDHPKVDHVVGIANGGDAPARVLASRLGAKVRTVKAQHNADAGLYRQATGKVTVDVDGFRRALGGKKLGGTVLVVDDICGSGATLHKLRNVLTPVLNPDARVVTATLCLNTGAQTVPDYSVWTVSDWVSFPWEKRPAQPTTDMPLPEQVTSHA